MGRFLGKLSSDVFGCDVDEIKIAHYNIPADKVVAADPDGLLDGEPFPDKAATVSTFLNKMPYAMNVTAVASGTQTGKITVHGTNMNGDPISEELTMNSSTPVVGSLAFADVNSVDLPQKVGSETIDLGWGNKFGLPYALTADELVIIKLFDNAANTGTITVDADEVEKNVFTLNGTADGKKPIDLYILV